MSITEVKVAAKTESQPSTNNTGQEANTSSKKNSIFTGSFLGTILGGYGLHSFVNSEPETIVGRKACIFLEKNFLKLKNPVAKHLFGMGVAGGIVLTGTLIGAGLAYLFSNTSEQEENQNLSSKNNNSQSGLEQIG